MIDNSHKKTFDNVGEFPCLPSYFNLTLIDTIENWQSEFLQLMGQVYPEKKREKKKIDKKRRWLQIYQ
jgi:hypothetical protein